jgi:hypothetical protein
VKLEGSSNCGIEPLFPNFGAAEFPPFNMAVDDGTAVFVDNELLSTIKGDK